MEVLGDPLSLVHNLGAGVIQFYRQTRAEVIGDSRTRGEGLKRLTRAVVSGAAGSASKITGSIAEFIRAVAGHDDKFLTPIEYHDIVTSDNGIMTPSLNDFIPLENQSEESVFNEYSSGFNKVKAESDNASSDIIINTEEVTSVSVSSGMKQGGAVLAYAVVAGLSSLIEEPAKGMQESGIVGASKGLVKGIVKAFSAPIMGALGAVSVVTESVELSTRYTNGAPVGRRRIGHRGPRKNISRNMSNSTIDCNEEP